MIINKTNNKIIANTVYLADTPLKRMQGLLGRRNFKASEAMVIKPCNSIHTFFMRFSIDILFINKGGKVVKCVANIPPFRLSPLSLSSRFVVELPAGTIQSTNTKEGDQIAVD